MPNPENDEIRTFGEISMFGEMPNPWKYLVNLYKKVLKIDPSIFCYFMTIYFLVGFISFIRTCPASEPPDPQFAHIYTPKYMLGISHFLCFLALIVILYLNIHQDFSKNYFSYYLGHKARTVYWNIFQIILLTFVSSAIFMIILPIYLIYLVAINIIIFLLIIIYKFIYKPIIAIIINIIKNERILREI